MASDASQGWAPVNSARTVEGAPLTTEATAAATAASDSGLEDVWPAGLRIAAQPIPEEEVTPAPADAEQPGVAAQSRHQLGALDQTETLPGTAAG